MDLPFPNVIYLRVLLLNIQCNSIEKTARYESADLETGNR